MRMWETPEANLSAAPLPSVFIRYHSRGIAKSVAVQSEKNAKPSENPPPFGFRVKNKVKRANHEW